MIVKTKAFVNVKMSFIKRARYMIPDYVKMNMDMSLSPDVDKFLKNEKIEDEEVDWLGEVEIENVLCEIGIQKDKKNIVVMSPKICFSVSVEELIRRHTRSE